MTYVATLEMLVDGAWVDITRLDEDTRLLDEGDGVSITRGRTDPQGTVATTEVTIAYLDSNATLDWDNPLSPYYRRIGQSTPLRVKVDGEVRALVELANLAPSWEDHPDVVQVSMQATGLFGRLGTGAEPLDSPLTRLFDGATPWQWWKLETGAGTQVITIPSSLAGGEPLFASQATAGSTNARVSGVVSGDQTVGPPGAAGAVDMSGGGQLAATLPLPGGPSLGLNYLSVEGAFQFAQPVDDVSGSGNVVTLNWGGDTVVGLFGGPASLLGALLVLEISSDSGEFISTTSNAMVIDDGAWHWVRLDFNRVTGVTFDYDIYIDSVLVFTGTTTGTALLDLTEFTISKSGEVGAASQWVIWKDGYEPADPDAGYTAFTGHAGETPVERFERLCDELGLVAEVIGSDYGNLAMGPQEQTEPLSLLLECGRVEGGPVYEHRTDADTVVMKTRAALYNQPPTSGVTLTYAQVGKPFRPEASGQGLANDVTADSPDGGSGRYVIPDGDVFHWSTEAPPTGAGTRKEQQTWNADQDDLNEIAAWAAHISAWREKRFSQVALNLARDAFDTATRAAVRALDVGAPMAIATTGAPRYVPYSEVRLLVQGYTETVTRHEHSFILNTSQADIYEVDAMDSGDTSTLAIAIDSDDTTVKLAPGLGPAWSEVDAPYHIQVAGEPMTVTAISTDTPAFVAASATVAAASNASVSPALPAGVAAGNLMLLWATIRNSGVGTVDTPSGWNSLANINNTRLFYRYYQAGDSAPTVTFTGGVANATTLARIFAFSGLSHEFASGTKANPTYAVSSNSSAQDMAYAALDIPTGRSGAAFIFAWKQDDWTGVAPPSGFTEMGDDASTLGDDAAIAAYYDLTGASAAAGTLTVTGGAAAISRTVVLALRPLQTATVTRNIAGVATSHTPGDEVHVWRPGVNGL